MESTKEESTRNNIKKGIMNRRKKSMQMEIMRKKNNTMNSLKNRERKPPKLSKSQQSM
jgi:hypothetical protein